MLFLKVEAWHFNYDTQAWSCKLYSNADASEGLRSFQLAGWSWGEEATRGLRLAEEQWQQQQSRMSTSNWRKRRDFVKSRKSAIDLKKKKIARRQTVSCFHELLLLQSVLPAQTISAAFRLLRVIDRSLLTNHLLQMLIKRIIGKIIYNLESQCTFTYLVCLCVCVSLYKKRTMLALTSDASLIHPEFIARVPSMMV